MTQRKLDWISKIGIGLILLSVILLIYTVIIWLVSIRNIKMPIGHYTYNDYNYALQTLQKDIEPIYSFSSNKELKSLIEEESGIKFYIYLERDLSGNDGGFAFPPFRTILVDNSTMGYDYCSVFAHEVMHIKRCSIQEDYIGFETFKLLYESKNEELHNYGVLYGIKQLMGEFNGEEDYCFDQIIGYFKSRKE